MSCLCTLTQVAFSSKEFGFAEEDDGQAEAATRIQATHRGKQQRKEAREMNDAVWTCIHSIFKLTAF